MAPRDNGYSGLKPSRRRYLFSLQAAALTLLIHAAVLFSLWLPNTGSSKAETQFAEVGLLEEALDFHTVATEAHFRAELERRVANLQSDASLDFSAERRSSGNDQLSEQVEAELRAFEAAEMARLAAEKKDFGLDGVPEIDQREVQTLSDWNRQYEGEVTVTFQLPGRQARFLDVPGYRCQGGGRVVVQVNVNRLGEVLEAKIVSVSDGDLQGCFATSALESAKKSSFFIDPQGEALTQGTITYAFVPQ